MNSKLLKSEVEKFITENYRSDLSRVIFSGSPFEGISTQEIAVQLKGKRTAEKKFPTLFYSFGIIYPPGLNLEQASSEITAEYKASLVTGNTFIDLTGGFGIDTLYFSRRFERCVYCEINPELAETAAHNFRILNRDNIEVHTTDGISFLSGSKQKYSCIYLDPSRRDTAGGRVFRLSQCIPDAGKNLDLLFSKSPQILIKTSPLLDLQAGISELQKVAEIHIVAVENDVKELIWILKETNDSRIIVKTVNFTKTRIEEYKNWFGENPQP
ncbi:MAG TPA: class I SAM-dependent methyltransferase, partial [Salinimicrobium sp.]|nr:class I SAM-dependent methyltransferase [Salinimicrobium sp.]